jgi:hypothetical protein
MVLIGVLLLLSRPRVGRPSPAVQRAVNGEEELFRVSALVPRDGHTGGPGTDDGIVRAAYFQAGLRCS